MSAWLSVFHFLRPVWLWLIPAAALVYLTHSFREDIRARWKRVIAPELLEHLIVKKTGRWTIRPIQMITLALMLSSFALAGPAWRREKPPFTEDKAPLVIAVDLSQTMDAIDQDPTRLERAKLKIHDLLRVRNGAPTALLVYAGTAHLVVPLTSDQQLFSMYLDALSTTLMPKTGKDTRQALASAKSLLDDAKVPGTVLFITDGIEEPARASLQNFADNTPDSILVLGVGTSRGGPIRTGGNRFVEDSSGRRLFSKLDVDALKSLSSIGTSATTLTLDNSDVEWIQRRVQTHLQTAQEHNTSRVGSMRATGWFFPSRRSLLCGSAKDGPCNGAVAHWRVSFYFPRRPLRTFASASLICGSPLTNKAATCSKKGTTLQPRSTSPTQCGKVKHSRAPAITRQLLTSSPSKIPRKPGTTRAIASLIWANSRKLSVPTSRRCNDVRTGTTHRRI
jgi:hypothetical protein